MLKVVLQEGLDRENAAAVCRWTNQRDADFLLQWAGPEMLFPLSVETVQGLSNVYSIFLEDEFAGMIQRIRTENNNVHIARFLVDPARTGKGIGKKALSAFIRLIFSDPSVHSISLSVLAQNVGAMGLYEKLGFEVAESIEHLQRKIIMKRARQ